MIKVNKDINAQMLISDAEKVLEEFIEIDLVLNNKKNLAEKIKKLLDMMKFVPASTNYHGSYVGGLYDHTILVFYFCYKNYEIVGVDKFSKTDVCVVALLHDLEKLWSRRDRVPNNKKFEEFYMYRDDEKKSNREILKRISKYKNKKFQGKSFHIDKTYSLIRNMDIELTDQQLFGLVFHHGGWSRYRGYNNYPESDEISAYLHSFDMIVSQTLNI